MLLCLCIALLVGGGTAHLCAVFPHQRGPMSLNYPGDGSCFRRVPECGGMPAQQPTVTLRVGSNVVQYQANLNHWNQAIPGAYDVSVSYDVNKASRDEDFEILSAILDFPAHEANTQTNFSVPIVLSKASSHAVLRFRYISNNPGEVYPTNNTRGIFWQCADIIVAAHLGDEAKQPLLSAAAKLSVVVATGEKRREAVKGCCTLPQFQLSAREVTAAGVTQHRVWWDQKSALVRWDKTLNGKTFYSYNNYSSGNEYTFDGTNCELNGNDPFYGWCFGNRAGEWMKPAAAGGGGDDVDHWEAANGWQWGSTRDHCYPAYSARKGSTNITFYGAGPLTDHSVFALPKACQNIHTKTRACGRQ